MPPLSSKKEKEGVQATSTSPTPTTPLKVPSSTSLQLLGFSTSWNVTWNYSVIVQGTQYLDAVGAPTPCIKQQRFKVCVKQTT